MVVMIDIPPSLRPNGTSQYANISLLQHNP